jgi:hypothetical protein
MSARENPWMIVGGRSFIERGLWVTSVAMEYIPVAFDLLIREIATPRKVIIVMLNRLPRARKR